MEQWLGAVAAGGGATVAAREELQLQQGRKRRWPMAVQVMASGRRELAAGECRKDGDRELSVGERSGWTEEVL